MNIIKMKKLISDTNKMLQNIKTDKTTDNLEKVDLFDKIINISFYNIDTIKEIKDKNYKWYKKAFSNISKFCIIGFASNLILGTLKVFEPMSTLFSSIALFITCAIPEIILSKSLKITTNSYNKNIIELQNIIEKSLKEKEELEIKIINTKKKINNNIDEKYKYTPNLENNNHHNNYNNYETFHNHNVKQRKK